MRHDTGRIEVICGCMFSGKSEELLRRLRRAEIARQTVAVFKPVIDERYGVSKVSSHDGRQYEATPIQKPMEIFDYIGDDITVVGIDEAQFFDDTIISVSRALADRNIRVIVAGLDLDFRGEPFGPMPFLMAEAEQVDKLHAICMVSGEPATRSQRLINGKPARYDDPVIQIGAQESYEARSRAYHEVPGRPTLEESIQQQDGAR